MRAGRAFNPEYHTNTWLPSAVSTTVAESAAGHGVIGAYRVLYSLLTVVLMWRTSSACA